MGPGGDAAIDGRAQRRLRNTDAVVEAILELLHEGDEQPTAQAVAERSGVSIRSIFRLFQDMEELHTQAIERQTHELGSLIEDVRPDGPLEQRVHALVANRADVFETVAPVRRFALRAAARSAPIRDGLARADLLLRHQVAAVFAAELTSARTNPDLLEALDAATSWPAWDRLRAGQGLSATRSRQTTELVVTALLRADA
ncbi:MAG TPA: TetR/AcrR family transcriptional regulator [Acidimicrobiales bacterium]|nr:TetR/AcrR family transcriptional regulator [Acidimicrobiales bacterium]